MELVSHPTQPLAAYLNALDCYTVHVCTELLVPEHSETFLQGQLEPVTTCHTIACITTMTAQQWR